MSINEDNVAKVVGVLEENLKVQKEELKESQKMINRLLLKKEKFQPKCNLHY